MKSYCQSLYIILYESEFSIPATLTSGTDRSCPNNRSGQFGEEKKKSLLGIEPRFHSYPIRRQVAIPTEPTRRA